MLLNLIQVELYLSDFICNQFLKIALPQTFEKVKIILKIFISEKIVHKIISIQGYCETQIIT